MLNNVSKFNQYSKVARLHFYFDQKDEKARLKNRGGTQKAALVSSTYTFSQTP